MKKTLKITLAATTAVFAFSGLAFAQETTQVPATIPSPKGIVPIPARPQVPMSDPSARNSIKIIQEKRADIRDAAKDVRSTFKVETKDLRTNTKEQMRGATSSTERREIEKNAIEQRKELLEARKASTTEIRDQKKELARQHIETIEQRYAIAIRQFDSLAARIQSRIDKMKANGIGTGKAESALGLVLTSIAQVKADAQTLTDLRTQVQSGGDAKALRTQIESAVKKLNESVKSTHKEFENAGKTLILSAKIQKSGSRSGTVNPSTGESADFMARPADTNLVGQTVPSTAQTGN